MGIVNKSMISLQEYYHASIQHYSRKCVLSVAVSTVPDHVEDLWVKPNRVHAQHLPRLNVGLLGHFEHPHLEEHVRDLSLIHISEPTRLLSISYAVFCLKKKK
eukprot:TRINITY_DN5947_c0_g2_i1.p1 TRINITY_DN5947_c0_g2~~TRINITY_DN5947_c0_g2_i1.p1  ORF type:complete len:103 (-),score=14.23 TRINITY_DN5947_c0_g2_i1:39-347(-)